MGQEYQRLVNVVSTVGINSNPWFFDGFESVFDWDWAVQDNTSATKSVITTQAYEGSKCLQLATGATAPTANEVTQPVKKVVFPGNRYIEVTMNWKLASSTNRERIYLWIEPIINGNDYFYGLSLNTQTNRIEYMSGSFNWTNVNSNAVYPNDGGWNFMRLMFDIVGGKYVRGQVNDQAVDLRSISGVLSGTVQSAGISIMPGIQILSAAQKTLYIDNVMLRGLDSI